MVSEQLVQDTSLITGENQSELRRRLQLIEEPDNARSPRMRKLLATREEQQSKLDEIDSEVDGQANFEVKVLPGMEREIARREHEILETTLLLDEAKESIADFESNFPNWLNGQYMQCGLARSLDNALSRQRDMHGRIQWLTPDLQRQRRELEEAKQKLTAAKAALK